MNERWQLPAEPSLCFKPPSVRAAQGDASGNSGKEKELRHPTRPTRQGAKGRVHRLRSDPSRGSRCRSGGMPKRKQVPKLGHCSPVGGARPFSSELRTADSRLVTQTNVRQRTSTLEANISAPRSSWVAWVKTSEISGMQTWRQLAPA